MKKIIVMMILIGAMSSFRGMEKLPADPINARELTGYSLKTNDIVFNDFNLWVFTNNVAFENTFVADNEMVARPGFENELVVAAKVETVSSSYNIRFKKIEIVKSELNVYLTVQKEGPARDGAGPVSLVTYPKHPQVKKVNFYHGNMLVRTIPIVTVY